MFRDIFRFSSALGVDFVALVQLAFHSQLNSHSVLVVFHYRWLTQFVVMLLLAFVGSVLVFCQFDAVGLFPLFWFLQVRKFLSRLLVLIVSVVCIVLFISNAFEAVDQFLTDVSA